MKFSLTVNRLSLRWIIGIAMIWSLLSVDVAISEPTPTTKPATNPTTSSTTKPRRGTKTENAKGDNPTTAPTTQRVQINVTGTPQGETEPLTFVLDITDSPESEKWARLAGDYAMKWYPKLCQTLPSEGYVPTRKVTLVFRSMKGVAYTIGNNIVISAAWIKQHPEDLGMVAHELTHVVQHYTKGERPGWLVEGIADYVRYYIVEPGSKQARFNADRGYKGGYQPAAGMINYIETNHPGAVVKLNELMRTAKYTPEDFKTIAGGDADETWEKFKATLQGK